MRAYLFALGVVSVVGCNEDAQPQREAGRSLPSRRAPDPAPQPERAATPPKVDLALGTGYEMRHPITDGRLTLIPIVAKLDAPATRYITLHDGMRRNLVSVRELGDWQVDTVRITNRAPDPLVALSGELIVDAMQDRVLSADVVVEPGATELVHVRCVEEDRETGGNTFHAGNAMTELTLRRTVVHDTQQAVWAKVKQINRGLGLTPKTNTYRLAAIAQTKGAVGERGDRILRQLAAIEERDHVVGLAVAVDGQVISIERLATPALYRQLEAELVASYLPGTDGDMAQAEGKKLSPDDVRRLDALAGTTTAGSHSVLRAL